MLQLAWVLIGVSFEDKGKLYASINIKAVDCAVEFGQEIAVSPKKLSKNKKIQRWQEIWFSDVKIKYTSSSAPLLTSDQQISLSPTAD